MVDPKAEAQVQPEGTTLQATDLSKLLEKEFKPKSDRAREAVTTAVQTLAEQALQYSTVISDDVVQTISLIIAALDKKLSEQINQIMHHEEFQKLEGAWRGLHHLVNNTETD